MPGEGTDQGVHNRPPIPLGVPHLFKRPKLLKRADFDRVDRQPELCLVQRSLQDALHLMCLDWLWCRLPASGVCHLERKGGIAQQGDRTALRCESRRQRSKRSWGRYTGHGRDRR
eukprot:scaffold13255_cov128-Isochrysis_galbana.AAC.1